MSAPNKISATHLERTAIISVRQSTMAHVRDNRESQARQYGLVEEAARLGWPASKIDVIDADLGLSGRSADRRSGFRELVSRVCLGEVGAIFGLEVSRLARSSADLARLLELARLTDTLIIDADGMYDLRDFNARLLLGLKGTMSEAELHLLAGRMQVATRVARPGRGGRTPGTRRRLHQQGQYVLNQQRLAANATRSGARPPRDGAALSQGIVYCGSCGRAMSTRYRPSGRADYDCTYS